MAKPEVTRKSKIAECRYENPMSYYDSTAGHFLDSKLDSASADWRGRERVPPQSSSAAIDNNLLMVERLRHSPG